MKQNLITDIIRGMLPYLNNAQCERLQEVLQYPLKTIRTQYVSWYCYILLLFWQVALQCRQ